MSPTFPSKGDPKPERGIVDSLMFVDVIFLARVVLLSINCCTCEFDLCF